MADTQQIRELERQLAICESSANADAHATIDILNELAWLLSDTEMKRAFDLAEQAYKLAQTPAEGEPSYPAGMAYSLRTLGYLNQRTGDYPRGMRQLLQALELIGTLKLDEVLPDVLDGIAGIYYQIGNYPETLRYSYQQLDAAQRIGDKRLIANAYNNLANIYFETGEYTRAVETLRQNLAVAAEIGYARIMCLSYLNLAETHLLAGEYETALEDSLQGLNVCQEAGFALFEVYAFDLVGKSHLRLNNPQRAINYLASALSLSRKLASQVTESLVLLNLGQAYRDMQQIDRAVETLRQGIAVAQSIDAKSELFKSHLLLAEIYEEQGELAQALVHFKKYQSLKEIVAGEKADERLKVLQVAHDTEAARQEAEFSRHKTVGLEQEIAERKRVEADLQDARSQLEQQVEIRTAELHETVALLHDEIEERQRAEAEIQQMVETLEQRVAARTDELATFFDLTLLAGQAVELTDVFAQALPRIAEVTHSRAICIHLFDADRTALCLAAQQSLPSQARTPLLKVDLPPKLQRWLQEPNDPLVSIDLSRLTILPPVFHLAEFQTYLGAQIKTGGRTEGILSCYRYTDRGFGLDEIALVMALADQIGMMIETHRLRQNAKEIAVLEERQRLARDLHDRVTQSLYSLSLFSRAGREAAEDGDADRLHHSLIELERNTLHTLREMRLLLYELRPADLEQEGLIRAIELRLNTVERRVGLQLDVQLDELPAMSPTDEVELYHLIVEALNNVVKHAAATHLTVRLVRSNGRLHLRIVDDGQGYDPVQTQVGLGLRNIRERVLRLDGRLTIASAPGQGTQLEAVIPYGLEEDL